MYESSLANFVRLNALKSRFSVLRIVRMNDGFIIQFSVGEFSEKLHQIKKNLERTSEATSEHCARGTCDYKEMAFMTFILINEWGVKDTPRTH